MRRLAALLLILAAAAASAAQPCIECHGGAAEKSYGLSKHGVIARLESRRERVRAPGCADCHAYEAKAQAPAHYAGAAEREQARRQAVEGCGACHAPRYREEQLAAAGRGLAIGEMKLREARAVLEDARRELKGEALAAVEAQFARMRDEHLRNLRLGLAHQSPDYQWWHGQAALDGDLLRIKGALGDARRSAAR
jgi:mono/diheme cytochrome c family protein